MKTRFHKAFSLLEIVMVISIITLLALFAIPAMTSMGQARRLGQGAQRLSEFFDLARAEAITRNRKVEVRLYRFSDRREADPSPAIAAVRSYFWESADKASAISPVLYLPAGICISELAKWTSLVALPQSVAEHPQVPEAEGECTYRSLVFYPDGSTNLAYGEAHFMTLAPRFAQETLKNYATLGINPSTGRTLLFQP